MSLPIKNPLSTDGYTALRDSVYSLEVPFEYSAAVTGPAVVSIGTDGRVATSATNGTASLVVGAAPETVASGDSGLVTLLGIVENITATGAIAAGDIVKRSATTAGAVSATATPAAGEAIGVAINASASNLVDIWLGPVALS